MATVAELRREVEIAREGLKNVDENIKKLTGRDPSVYRPPGRRVSLKRDFNDRTGLQGPQVKRQDATGARGRLWSRVVVTRTSQDEPRPSQRQDSDGEEEDDESKKPAIQSSVIATRMPVRLKRETIVNDDAKTKSRNRRMFGMLLGTLQKFKQDSASKSEKDIRREEINKKLEQKEKQEKEEVETQRKELFTARRAKQAELRRLEWKVELTAMQEEWDQNSLKLCNAIKTKVSPSIFYLPAKHTDKTQKLLEESSRAVKRAMAKRRAEIEEELEKQAEIIKASTTEEGGTNKSERGEKREHRISEGGGDVEMGVVRVKEEGDKGESNHDQTVVRRMEDGDTREVIITEEKEQPMDEGDMD